MHHEGRSTQASYNTFQQWLCGNITTREAFIVKSRCVFNDICNLKSLITPIPCVVVIAVGTLEEKSKTRRNKWTRLLCLFKIHRNKTCLQALSGE